MHFIAGIPLVLATVSFILTMLAIFAGNQPGYMEDYHIIYVGLDRARRIPIHDDPD